VFYPAPQHLLAMDLSRGTRMGQREGRCSLGAGPPPPAPGQVAEAEAPWVALSFDDVPSETCTPAILDTLALWQARASFFVLGRHALRLDHLVRQASNEGHTLGCHSFSHRGVRPVWDIGALKWELELGRGALWRSAGVETDLYRAPTAAPLPGPGAGCGGRAGRWWAGTSLPGTGPGCRRRRWPGGYCPA
jgi:peptidoglycan/xylan/chitin deacetylase (PgdA/CDA1 family)